MHSDFGVLTISSELAGGVGQVLGPNPNFDQFGLLSLRG
jgi:hypothetical protein